MAALRYTSRADQEAVEAEVRYLVETSPAIADDFEAALRRAEELVVSNPEIGHRSRERFGVPGTFRSVPLHGFPYLFVYSVEEDGSILVAAVAHTSRKEAYRRD